MKSPIEELMALKAEREGFANKITSLEAELAGFRAREAAAKAAATAADQRRVEGPQTKRAAIAEYDAIRDQAARTAYRRKHWAILGLEKPSNG
jgi:hypothetical protein